MTEETRAIAESLEPFVQQQQQSGKYQSYEQIVQAGLNLLQKHEEELDCVADALRPALQDLCFRRARVNLDFPWPTVILSQSNPMTWRSI
jgi:hypothetical protein